MGRFRGKVSPVAHAIRLERELRAVSDAGVVRGSVGDWLVEEEGLYFCLGGAAFEAECEWAGDSLVEDARLRIKAERGSF